MRPSSSKIQHSQKHLQHLQQFFFSQLVLDESHLGNKISGITQQYLVALGSGRVGERRALTARDAVARNAREKWGGASLRAGRGTLIESGSATPATILSPAIFATIQSYFLGTLIGAHAGRVTLVENGLVTRRNTDANPDTGFVMAVGTAETRHDRINPTTQVP